MQKKAELMDSGYAILDWSTHTLRFLEKLLEGTGLPFKLKQYLVTCFSGMGAFDVLSRKSFEVGANCTH